MARISYFGTLLTIAALCSASISAQTPSAQTPAPKSASGNARVQDVVVRGSGAAMEVEIKTSGAPVTPNAQVITDPDRIIVDFPGALPADAVRKLALKVNSPALRGVRSGLFLNNPPITRVVLDLAEPQSYQISTTQNAIVVKLGPAKPGSTNASSTNTAPAKTDSAKTVSAKTSPSKTGVAKLRTVTALKPDSPNVKIVRTPRLQSVVAVAEPKVAPAEVSTPVVDTPPKPPVTVSFVNGMLSIHAEKATLAQVLFEVQVQTQAEIAIPAGAEQEQVISDLGPAPARDVLASLLNGSPYNFIFVGNELSLERVILTRRDPNIF
jgi:hypothetical protein